MAQHPRVSHCYERNRAADWRYNLYTMIHGYSREECERIAAELGAAAGIEDRCMLYTKKEWKKTSGIPKDFAPLLKYGIVKERFSALLTDALRCESLEGAGYSVQLLEFIDMEHTPKNLLIRAVKKSGTKAENLPGEKNILNTLEIFPMLEKLLKNHR